MVYYKGQTPATPAERQHLARVKELPCCLCLPGEQESVPDNWTEANHLKCGNKRMGHYFVVPYCRIIHHPKAHLYVRRERDLWQQTVDTLGVIVTWPTSKLVPRRAV
jgi:hypothetical protein